MFTGLIEEIGQVRSIIKGQRSIRVSISAKRVLEGLHIGDSIATCGICLTVIAFTDQSYTADVMPETLNRTTLSTLRPGDRVNLERALRLGDRLGGHLVSGHIDSIGRITDIKRDDTSIWYTLTAPPSTLQYIIEKGSVALDGVSLTVAACSMTDFKVSIIPHTSGATTLADRRIGDIMNIECDQMGKYLARIAQFSASEQVATTIDMAFLESHGFI